jgi:MFS family permease
VIAGQGVSLVGSYLTAVAVPWLVLSLTGNGFAFGMSFMLVDAPRQLLTLPAGAVADRFTARRVTLLANAMLGTVMTALGLLALFGRVSIIDVYAAGLVVGISTAFGRPAQFALVSQLTPQDSAGLVRANAWHQGSSWAAQLTSAALAVLVWSLMPHRHPVRGCGLVFLIDAASYLACLILVRRTTSHTAAKVCCGVIKSTRQGVGFVCRERGLVHAFLGSACFALAVNSLLQISIPMQVHQLTGSNGGTALSLVSAAFGVGGLVGAAATRWYKPLPHRTIRLQYGAMIIEGMLFALASQAHTVWQLGLLELAVGVIGTYSSISFVAMVMQVTPESVRCRVGAMMMVISMTPVALLYPAIGGLAQSHTSLVYLSAAAILMAGGIIFPRSPHIRALPQAATTAGSR